MKPGLISITQNAVKSPIGGRLQHLVYSGNIDGFLKRHRQIDRGHVDGGTRTEIASNLSFMCGKNPLNTAGV